jgi:hypothetical protein
MVEDKLLVDEDFTTMWQKWAVVRSIYCPGFDICGSVHHHLINKTTNVMQLGAIVFIIPWKALHMFRVLFTPIIRSVLKPYMQLLVQSFIGMVSDPVCYKTIRRRERAALCHD